MQSWQQSCPQHLPQPWMSQRHSTGTWFHPAAVIILSLDFGMMPWRHSFVLKLGICKRIHSARRCPSSWLLPALSLSPHSTGQRDPASNYPMGFLLWFLGLSLWWWRVPVWLHSLPCIIHSRGHRRIQSSRQSPLLSSLLIISQWLPTLASGFSSCLLLKMGLRSSLISCCLTGSDYQQSTFCLVRRLVELRQSGQALLVAGTPLPPTLLVDLLRLLWFYSFASRPILSIWEF